jgi:hypothetical protein
MPLRSLPAQGAEKGKAKGPVATESITIAHGGLKRRKPRALKGKDAGSGQMENLRLQENLAQRQRAETLRSNAAKKQDETNKSMIKKMK